jgi:hypothetical protein
VIIVPFRPFHVDLIRAQGVQAAQLRAVSHVPASYASVEQPHGPAVSAFDGDRVLLCGGIQTYGSGRGIVWAILGEVAGRHMTALHYAAKRFLTMDRYRRLECTVEEGFAAGCRWVELLGFRFEGKMPMYGDDGETHLRFGRYG